MALKVSYCNPSNGPIAEAGFPGDKRVSQRGHISLSLKHEKIICGGINYHVGEKVIMLMIINETVNKSCFHTSLPLNLPLPPSGKYGPLLKYLRIGYVW